MTRCISEDDFVVGTDIKLSNVRRQDDVEVAFTLTVNAYSRTGAFRFIILCLYCLMSAGLVTSLVKIEKTIYEYTRIAQNITPPFSLGQ
jgi:hypothetical protein